MLKIEQTYVIGATPLRVWRALTDPVELRQRSGANVEFPLEVGASYSLWNGSIGGKIVEIVPNKKLVQTWKPDNWTIENSIVTFKLTRIDGGTRVDLVHDNVEEFDYAGTVEGWNLYYLGAIQRMLEERSQQKKHPPKKRLAHNKATARKTARKHPVRTKKSNIKNTVRGKNPRKKTGTVQK